MSSSSVCAFLCYRACHAASGSCSGDHRPFLDHWQFALASNCPAEAAAWYCHEAKNTIVHAFDVRERTDFTHTSMRPVA